VEKNKLEDTGDNFENFCEQS